MGFLIDDLLKLSRVSRTEIKKVNVDLTSLAKDITKRLIKIPTDRRFEIIIQPGMFTMGDQSMLDIALTNLLDNAYKFTSRQQIARIEFGQSVIADKQTYWVKDNGVGFDMSYSKNLFGAFQRMHKQSDFPGTGIGLATVQRIIHRHDGEIWVESKKDQGTTFYFTITDETR
jgi:light-regulated signal transduction histidine kinase (bacteriophytochrome)